MITIKTCLAAALGLVLLAGATTTASARSLEAQCDAYARNQAAPYGRGGNVVGGAILGAGTGAVLGGILDGRRGARKGAAIGAGAGALGGAAAQSRQWRRVYDDAYYRCIEQNRRAPVRATRGGRPEPWTDEWYSYCAAKYRSFDPRSGTYQPHNGPRKLCR